MKKGLLALLAALLLLLPAVSCRKGKELQSRPGYFLYFYETADDGTRIDDPALIIKTFRYQDGTGDGKAFDNHTPSLVIRFNDSDSEAFFRFTEKNQGKQAVMYYRGKELLSAVIMEPIAGGEVRIICTSGEERDRLLELLSRE